jgi:hypothetical protein
VLNDKGTPLVESYLRETIENFVDNTSLIFIVLHVLEHRLQKKDEKYQIDGWHNTYLNNEGACLVSGESSPLTAHAIIDAEDMGL